MDKLVQLREKLDTLRAKLAKIFETAGDGVDFTRSDVQELVGASSSIEVVEKVRALNAEITAVHDEATELAEVIAIRDGLATVGDGLQAVADPLRHPDSGRVESLGAMFIASEAFQRFQAQGGLHEGQLEGWGYRELRATLLESTDGVPPEAVRSGRFVEGETRPIQVLDIIPGGSVGSSAYVYMEETLRTHSAAERREGATYAEDAYKWTERSEPVRSVGTSLPVTDEQLEDVMGLRSYIDLRLAFGLRQRVDGQVLTGDGIPPNLEGLLNRNEIQTQAKGADPVPDAIHKAMTLVRVTGRAFPNFVVMHPNDWEGIRLLRTGDGIYIWGSPAEAVAARIWGLPVVQTDAQTENTALVGDFTFCQLLDRRGTDVQVGYTGTQFVEGKKTIRADLRVAFACYRPPAFCTVTGI